MSYSNETWPTVFCGCALLLLGLLGMATVLYWGVEPWRVWGHRLWIWLLFFT